jgi:hypothetical protein
MYTPIACAAGMVLRINGKFTMGKLKSRYKEDVLSLDNYVDRIYPIEPEIKDTTYTDMSASNLDLHLEIDRGQCFLSFY